MKIYFVRHGSTDSLEKKISQPDDEPLNERGLAQAKELGKRFASVELDLVVSSPHLRAVQTAKAINPNVFISELFEESKKPTEIVGVSHEDENFKRVIQKINEMYVTNPTWHYSDEENFDDLKKRGLEALDYLKNLDKENVLVVSHGNFLSLLAGLMIFGNDYNPETALKFRNFLRLSNTGVCIFTYENEKWKLQCWNDTSHCLE